MSDSLQPQESQYARPPYPSPTPRVHSNSCPLSQWCHPTISSSVVPFSSHLQSFLASGSFQMSQFLASGGQSTVVSASASVLPMNIQDLFPLGWTAFFIVQLLHPYMTTGKTTALTIWTFVSKITSLLFNMLSRFVIAFLPSSKCLLISWFAVTGHSDFGVQEKKACHCFHCFPIYLSWSDGTGCHDLSFLNVEF